MSFQETFDIIKSLVQPKKISVCTNATLVIEVKGKHATLRKIEIVSVGTSAFSIKLDECGFPGQSTFNNHPSLHRSCDALTFCEVDGSPYIICCELKSSEPSRREVAEQFRSAHCFLIYLDALLSQYYRCQPVSKWPRRYYVFHNGLRTPLSKSPSRGIFENDTPDRAVFMAVNNAEKIYVRKLINVRP